MADGERDRDVLCVLVVGFHHQKGSQVEYSYPPPVSSLPLSWKFLPYAAIPDGAHRTDSGFVYFTLPQHEGTPNELNTSKIFAVACYGQIATQDLVFKDKEQTRSTVLKSIVVIIKKPCYGFIKAKLSLVTEVYFKQKNFAETKILEEFYDNLNQSLKESHGFKPYCYFVGLSIQSLVQKFRNKLLTIFKLLLLEQKVLFHGFPPGEVCEVLMSVMSLFPGKALNTMHAQIWPINYSRHFQKVHKVI
jgi:hypothetical protein